MSDESWLDNLNNQNLRVYSQLNQDGVIKEIFRNIGTTNKHCVEFGFNSTELTGGSGSNVARLVIEDNWKCTLFDGDNENPDINLHKRFITPDNVILTFDAYGVPKEPDYLSIDIDSTDLWVLQSILGYGFRPRLISVEYNSNFKPHESVTVLPETTWENFDAVYGASLCALTNVANSHGYKLIATVPRLDAFFIRGDLIKSSIPYGYFDKSQGIPNNARPTSVRLKSMVTFPELEPLPVEMLERIGE